MLVLLPLELGGREKWDKEKSKRAAVSMRDTFAWPHSHTKLQLSQRPAATKTNNDTTCTKSTHLREEYNADSIAAPFLRSVINSSLTRKALARFDPDLALV